MNDKKIENETQECCVNLISELNLAKLADGKSSSGDY